MPWDDLVSARVGIIRALRQCSRLVGRCFEGIGDERVCAAVASELENEKVLFYYYVDYEEFDSLEDGLGRFHAQWRRENPTDGVTEEGQSNE